jgi:DNA-binding response OmpR family regulator
VSDAKKILVVDDDPVTRSVVKRFLEQSSYQVEIMEDSQLALEYLVSPSAPHIAVIDWMMPGLSGLELCAKLRQHKLPIQPHVLILTSRKEKADVAMALDSGADDFLVKPFNVLEMRARLRVAERAVGRQLDLYRQIVELNEALAARPEQGRPQTITTIPAREGSLRRQDRSGPERSGGHSGSGGLGGGEPGAELAGTMVPGPPELPLSVDEVDAILLEALGGTCLGGAMASDAPALSRREPWISWTGAILMRANIWIDQMVEVEESAAFRDI